MNVRIKFHGSDDEVILEGIVGTEVGFYKQFNEARASGELLSAGAGGREIYFNPKYVLYMEFVK